MPAYENKAGTGASLLVVDSRSRVAIDHRMAASPRTLERAFEIAKSGSARNVEDVRRQLKAERFEQVESHLGGASIQKQLKDIIRLRVNSG
jgi:hypothetical protein